MKRSTLRLLVFLVLASLCARPAIAQDAQFWHNHYGTSGVLLGGTVIGSVEDLSAVFYNPGFLGLRPNPGLAIGTSVFDVSYLELQTDSVFTEPLDRFEGQVAPGLVAGQFNLGDDVVNHLTYSLIGRQSFNTVVQGQAQGVSENGKSLQSYYLRQDLTEYWGGITWSRPISESVGFGVSLFGAYRGQRRRTEFISTKEVTTGALTTISDVNWNFWNFRMLLKAGVYAEDGDWTYGATVTTPALSLFGSGNASNTLSIAGSPDGAEDRLTVLSSPGGNTTYHSPLSIGVGAGYTFDNIRLHGSLEWFAAVGGYEVMAGLRSLDPTVADVSVIDQMRSILNGGVGIQIKVSDKLSWYLSTLIDLSTVSSDFEQVLALSSWDVIHLNGGAVFQVDRFVFTTGLGFALGTGSVYRQAWEPGYGPELIIDPTVNVNWGRIRALLGVTFAP